MSTGPAHRTPNHRPGTAELLVQLAGELGNLVSQHVALAKLELGETARRTGLGVAQIAAFAPLVLVGYAFLNAAAALALSRWLPLAAAVALVGLLNVVVGLVGVALAARSFRRPALDDSVTELERTVHALAPSRPSNGHSALEQRP
ncbi:MAG TPA: phage holin family protein [Myxococcaceae bacterium]|nr:phage holin family protein [Myxococcaceae bacterium]